MKAEKVTQEEAAEGMRSDLTEITFTDADGRKETVKLTPEDSALIILTNKQGFRPIFSGDKGDILLCITVLQTAMANTMLQGATAIRVDEETGPGGVN